MSPNRPPLRQASWSFPTRRLTTTITGLILITIHTRIRIMAIMGDQYFTGGLAVSVVADFMAAFTVAVSAAADFMAAALVVASMAAAAPIAKHWPANICSACRRARLSTGGRVILLFIFPVDASAHSRNRNLAFARSAGRTTGEFHECRRHPAAWQRRFFALFIRGCQSLFDFSFLRFAL